MSLINDALKKAQKQRTGEAPALGSMPAIGGESPRSIAARGKSPGLNALALRIGLGAAALVGVIGITVVLLRDKPVTSAAATLAPAPVAQNTPAKPAPAANETVFVLPIAPPPATPAPAVIPEPRIEPPPASTPAAAVVTAPPPEAAPAKLEPRAMTFIDNIRVAGIRASGTDSKVLMNDRVYRVGDIVEHEMALRLVEITSNSLTFEDAAGSRFTRNF